MMTYITLSEAARRLHVCRATVYIYAKKYGLPIDRSQAVARIDIDALQRWEATFTPPKVGRPVGRNPAYKARGQNDQRRALLRASLIAMNDRSIAEQAQALGLAASYVKKLRTKLRVSKR